MDTSEKSWENKAFNFLLSRMEMALLMGGKSHLKSLMPMGEYWAYNTYGSDGYTFLELRAEI